MGVVNLAVSDRVHGCRHDGQAGAPGPGHLQPHRGLCHVPRRGDDLALLLGRKEREPKTAALSGSQFSGSHDRPLADACGFPHLLRRFQGKVLVQTSLNQDRIHSSQNQAPRTPAATLIHDFVAKFICLFWVHTKSMFCSVLFTKKMNKETVIVYYIFHFK